MITLEGSFLHLPSLEVWWPDDARQLRPLLPSAPTLSVMQCSASVAAEVTPFAFRHRHFDTLLIDLRSPEEQLRRQLNKTCRWSLKKAEQLDPHISINQDPDAALALLNRSYKEKRYRAPMSRDEWARLRRKGDVFLIEHKREPVAAHVVLADPPARARLLTAATAARHHSSQDTDVGFLNRLLHWTEIKHYKERGFSCFDFGGVMLDPSSELYSITLFKLSFGGAIVREHILRLCGNRVLRELLRETARIKTLVRPNALVAC